MEPAWEARRLSDHAAALGPAAVLEPALLAGAQADRVVARDDIPRQPFLHRRGRAALLPALPVRVVGELLQRLERPLPVRHRLGEHRQCPGTEFGVRGLRVGQFHRVGALQSPSR